MDGLTPRDAEVAIRAARQDALFGGSDCAASIRDRLEQRKRELNPAMEKVSLKDVHLPEATMTELRSAIVALLERDRLLKLNIKVCLRPILLVGAPGGGKTMIARAIASETKGAFIDAGLSKLKAGHLGQSASKIQEVFGQARARVNGVIFIDEIDCLAPSRSDIGKDSLTKEVVGYTCWRRLVEWQEAGVWERIWITFLEQLNAKGRLDFERVSIDSSSIRAQKGGSFQDRTLLTAASSDPITTSPLTGRAFRSRRRSQRRIRMTRG